MTSNLILLLQHLPLSKFSSSFFFEQANLTIEFYLTALNLKPLFSAKIYQTC